MTRIAVTSDFTAYVAPPSPVAGAYWGPNDPVLTGGSDAAGDGTKEAPFASPQMAADVLFADYDFKNRYRATIQLAVAPQGLHHMYPGLQVSGKLIGQGGTIAPLVVGNGLPVYPVGKYRPFTLRGDPANPMGAFLNPGADGRPAMPGLSLTDEASMKVTGVTFDTTLCRQDCVGIYRSFLDLSHCHFGNAGPQDDTSENLHIAVAFQSHLMLTGPYSISGGAGSHIQIGQSSSVYTDNNGVGPPYVVPISGNPKFVQGFVWCNGPGDMYLWNTQYVGTTRGAKARITRNGVLETNSNANLNYLPGDGTVVLGIGGGLYYN